MSRASVSAEADRKARKDLGSNPSLSATSPEWSVEPPMSRASVSAGRRPQGAQGFGFKSLPVRHFPALVSCFFYQCYDPQLLPALFGLAMMIVAAG
jgi:hypothetical protein